MWHGGVNALRVPAGHVLNYPGRGAYYLGAIHSIGKSTGYLNYLVEFAGESPFAIERVSDPLPLLQMPQAFSDGSAPSPLAFLSGLSVMEDGRCLLSYGSTNAEARLLSLNPGALHAAFSLPLPTKK